MATYGEIVEPGTRTAWEDWDDLYPENCLSQLKWEHAVTAPNNIDIFVIIEGNYLYDSIEKQSEFGLELINSVKEIGLHLYKEDSTNKYVCFIKDYNLLHSSEIVELLKPYLALSKDVLTIQTKPLAEYQAFELSNKSCIVRTVTTTKPSSFDLDFLKLEQPNIIAGVSAGVICLREHLSLSGKALICYLEHPEEYQEKEIQLLLINMGIVPNNPKPSSILNSNLYI